MSTVTAGRIFVFALVVLPSPYVLKALGGSASPAMLLGLCMFVYWSLTRLTSSMSASHSKQPIRIACYAFLLSVVASGAAAYARVLPLEESQAPLRGIAIALSFIGVCLFFADGIKDRIDLEKIVTALVLGGTFVAIIGLLQFITGNDIAPFFKLPGFGAVNDVWFVQERNGIPRVSGTAYHPIEYAVVLCTIWPLALRYAVMNWEKRSKVLPIIPLLLITAGIPTAMSRTAVVGFLTVFIIMTFVWSPRRRLRVAGTIALSIGALFLIAPKIPQTIINLFTKADEDISVTTRTEDYENSREFISNHLLFGRGFKTFDPSRYFFVDNQYLLSMLETGIIGTITLLALFITAITLARNVRHTAPDEYTIELGQAFVASLVGILVCFATFDTLSFPMIAFLSMTLIGLTGALWRINRCENGDDAFSFYSVPTNKKEELVTQ